MTTSVRRNVPWKRRFFSLWIGQAFSLMGSSLVSFALVWWLTVETESPAMLAAGTFAAVVPGIVLGPFSGTIIDRFSRKAVMLLSDGFVALLTMLMVYLFYLDRVEPWLIILILCLREIGGTFQRPAMVASTTLMVPDQQLSRISGMNQALGGVLKIVAPPAGAMLISALPMHLVLSIDVLTAALAMLPLLAFAIPQPKKKGRAGASTFWADTREGLRYVVAWRALFLVVMSCTCANVFLGATSSFLSLLVTKEFGGGALELSYVSSASGFGLIAGGLLMSAWKGLPRRLITSAIGWIGIGVAYAVASMAPAGAYPLFLAMMFAVGFMTPVGCAPINAFYQSCIPPDKQGRVLSVLNSLDNLTVPIGLILAGLLGNAVPLRVWYLLVGASHVALGGLWLGIPFIRNAENEANGRRPI